MATTSLPTSALTALVPCQFGHTVPQRNRFVGSHLCAAAAAAVARHGLLLYIGLELTRCRRIVVVCALADNVDKDGG